jgi:hypothetical protein
MVAAHPSSPNLFMFPAAFWLATNADDTSGCSFATLIQLDIAQNLIHKALKTFN